MSRAGADTDEAARRRLVDKVNEQLFPEPEPFRWPGGGDRRRSWLRRVSTHARLRLAYERPPSPAGQQRLLLRLGRSSVGRLQFQACNRCRRGYVLKLEVDDRYRGLGVGGRAIRAVRRRYRGVEWRTTPHYLTSGTFWAKMVGQTGGFHADADGRCPHMRDAR